MGFIDNFSAEDRIPVKFSELYELVRAAAERDLLIKALKTDVPVYYMRDLFCEVKEEMNE